MANYSGQQAFTISFTADEDLTGKQWMLVKTASTVGNVAAVTSACAPLPVGVLVNDPSAGQAATVVVWGFVKARGYVNACYLTHGAWVTSGSNGNVEPALATDGTEPIIGRWFGPRVATVDASLLGDVFIMPIPASIGASQAAGQ